MSANDNKHLPRLETENYCGNAFVHWTMTIEDRKTGWLTPAFFYEFRELLTHTAFRYYMTCPIFCLMPDHIHIVLNGLNERSNQLNAIKYLRKQTNEVLRRLGMEFQHQSHDRVLRDDERQENSFHDLVEYIARNPERADLVPRDQYSTYKYTGCLVPGYPELNLWQPDFWPRFWRTCSFSRRNGLFRAHGERLE